MQTQVTKLNFEGKNIYIGLDTHKKSWKVSLYTDEIALKTFTQDPKPDLLVNYLSKNYPNATYYCAYEAGFCGFWIQKALTKKGVNCIVVNPSDIPTTHKEKEFKTDPRDCRKIARSLRGNELEPIYVPTDVGLGARNIVRLYHDTAKNLTRYKNKIKGLLNFYGIDYPVEFQQENTHWSNSFHSWLKQIEFNEENITWTFQYYVQEYLKAKEQKLLATRKVRKLSKEERYSKLVYLLRTIPGIGLITAMIILTEIENIDRFKNLDSLCGYIGIIPTTKSTGEKEKIGEMTNRGNKYIKSQIIESAWMAIRYDPALSQKYFELKCRMDGNKAIIRIAKKLVSRIMFVLVNQKPYEIRKIK